MLQQTETPTTNELILQRLDTIAAELQLLRQAILRQDSPELDKASENIAAQLYGALGQGAKNEYDLLLEWERFNDEQVSYISPWAKLPALSGS